MEDENEIELSLGLSLRSSSGKSKVKDSSIDPKVDDGSGGRLVSGNRSGIEGPFKQFFNSSNEIHPANGLTKNNQQENFWTDLKKVPSQGADASVELLGAGGQLTRYHQDLWSESSSNKRKFPYEEIRQLKKHEEEVEAISLAVKSSHTPVTIEDGSSAENEDVADSEAEGPTSRHSSQHNESTRQYVGSGYIVPRNVEKHGFVEANGIDTQAQKQSKVVTSEGNLQYRGSRHPLQPMTVMNLPYSLPVNAPSNVANSQFMQALPSSTGEQSAFQSTNASNFQKLIGYSTVQLPTLEQFSAYTSQSLCGGISNTDRAEDGLNLPHGDRRLTELAKGNKLQVPEEAGMSSPQMPDESKGTLGATTPKDSAEQPLVEGFPYEGSVIRPGIAAGVKFGGSGTHPELPWVSTTGAGPHGRTISGVPYRCGKNQIRIVCACHGSHLSPDEFVQHASTETPSLENNTVVASFLNNPAASAQS